MHKLEGHPETLANRAKDLSASAVAIQDASEALFSLGFSSYGESIDAITDKADDLAEKLKSVHARYRDTASALTSYAIDLQQAHALADDAISDFNSNGTYAQHAISEADELRRERRLLEDSDPASPKLDTIDDDIRDWNNARARYENHQHDATAQWNRAQNKLNEAAEVAISRIDAALSSTNDGFLDHVGDFLGNIAGVLAAVALWVAQVLKTIVDNIETIILIVVGALIVIALLMVLSVWLVLVAPILAAINLLLLLTFLVPGMESWRTQLVALLVSVAIPAVGALLLWRIGSDIFAPDLEVGKVDPRDWDDPKARDALHDANRISGLYTVSDYMYAEGLADTMGGEDRTVINIMKVVGPDGVERWVVTLPSTQDWEFSNGDTGAVNDLDSNLALMLTPEMQTRYERAVLEAMSQAGIDSNDPVMLVGFSQGGIMAGNLASNSSLGYNIDAVLSYGAPIDAMNIPQSTRVLNIQHDNVGLSTGDVVPLLDFTSPAPNTANHVSVVVPAYDGTVDYSSHSNDKYRETAIYSPAMSGYQDFFSDFSGTVVDSEQFECNE